MEYVRGKDLRDVIKQLRATRTLMPLGHTCHVLREVAQALHHAYWSTDMEGKRLSVVHRDVSPHNIILGYDGSVKLLDFGVAMSAVTEQAETMIVGKWQYMSPEHTTNQALDHRSDLFSLGVIMYLLFTGSLPFAGNDPKEIVKKIRSGLYKPLQQVAPDVPEGLAVLVGRLLSPNPNDRPQTGHEVVATLTEITRSYGIESTAPNIALFLGEMFPNERSDSGAMEAVRPELELSATRLGVGMNSPAPTSADDGRSSLGGQSQNPANPAGPRSRSSKVDIGAFRKPHDTSAPPMAGPGPGPAPNPMSIPPPRQHHASAPIPHLKSTWTMSTRSYLVVVGILVLILVAYLVVRPG
jgi:serine/threonine protein kinase